MNETLVAVMITAPKAHAEPIARALVEARLAACVNVLPAITSIYRWKGEVQRDEETLLVAKTRASLVPALTEAVKRLHPYEVPEVVALPLAEGVGNPAYLAWLLAETEGAGS